jgi:hypothetical protein
MILMVEDDELYVDAIEMSIGFCFGGEGDLAQQRQPFSCR